MSISKIFILLAVTLQMAFAQSYAQPVREVQKEAYTAVSGYCQIIWGQGSSAAQSCAALTVPPDRIVAVRQASVQCSGRTGDSFSNVNLLTSTNSMGPYVWSWIPLQAAASPQTAHQSARVGLSPVFAHAAPGTAVRFAANFAGQSLSAGPAFCTMSFQGYFLPAVQ